MRILPTITQQILDLTKGNKEYTIKMYQSGTQFYGGTYYKDNLSIEFNNPEDLPKDRYLILKKERHLLQYNLLELIERHLPTNHRKNYPPTQPQDPNQRVEFYLTITYNDSQLVIVLQKRSLLIIEHTTNPQNKEE